MHKGLLVTLFSAFAFSSSLQAQVKLTPASLSFGNQVLSTASAVKTVTVKNAQTVPLTISSISVAGDYTQTNNCGTLVVASGSCTISVAFTPQATGSRTGTLTITDDAGTSPQTVALSGTGVVAATATPASLGFGSQVVATASAAKVVTLKNNQTVALNISSITVTGDFSQTNTCGSSVAAGGSCLINVVFTPSVTGSRTGNLTIADTAANSPHSVSLSGTGILPATETPASLAFGQQVLNVASTAKTATLKNNQTVPLNISSITVSGDYSQTNTCGAVLAAVSTCTINVIFKPTATGSRTGTLTISDDAANSPQTTALSGTGVLAATATPASLAFGSQVVGFPSAAKAVTLKNNQSIPLNVSSIAVSGDYSQTNTCGTSINAGASCTINVVLTPTATGSRTATLTIADDAANSPQTVSLTGTGLAQVTLSPASLSFGKQAVGLASTPLAVTLTNNKPVALTISSITTSGDYAQTNTCGTSVAANATCTVSVTFTPAATGSRTGVLTIADSASPATQTANLTGTGVTTPQIGSLSPTSATQGTLITITGANFGASQGASTLTFNGTPATPASWSKTKITAPVPLGATTGPVVLTVSGVASNGVTLTLPPVLSAVSPTSGTSGTPVQITGANFGTAQGTNTITFNGKAATATNWTPGAINVTVPIGSSTGNLVVTVNGVASNGLNFTVIPPALSTIMIMPANQVLAAGGTLQFTATGIYADGSTQDLTSTATWTSSASSVATIAAGGLATATASGVTTIQASSGAISSSTILTVPGFSATSALNVGRHNHTATLLPSGKVLILGGFDGQFRPAASAELYDPASKTFTFAGSLLTARAFHTATLLDNGMVIVTGGVDSNGSPLGSAEIYDPASATSFSAGNMTTVRASHTATLLGNGNILITGGYDQNFADISAAEIYNVSAGSFTQVGSLATARDSHTATLLNNGKVLIAGGQDTNGTVLANSELYDPVAATFTSTGNLNAARISHTTTMLNSGQVLIAGGRDANFQTVAAAELFDPSSDTFIVTGSLINPRLSHSATILASGKVLLAGGTNDSGGVLPFTEVFDSKTGSFTSASSLNISRFGHTATFLRDGTALFTGGQDSDYLTEASSEVYQPDSRTPSGLMSITVSSSGPPISEGASTTYVASGTFSDNSTKILASALWSSSNEAVVSLTNDQTNHGHGFGVGAGTATISACAGTICGSAAPSTIAAALNLLSVSPASGPVGATVFINGSGFGASQGSNTVTFNGVAAQIVRWGETSIVATVPSGAGTGPVVVTVGGTASNAVNFTVLPVPIITGVSPSAAPVGATVSITGSNFGMSQGSSTITFNGTPATATTWTDGNIVVSVPTGATTGSLVVTVQGLASAPVFFPVLAPANTLKIQPPSLNMIIGASQQFSVSDAQNVTRTDATWLVDNTTVASITNGSSPTLTAIAAGQVTLTTTVLGLSVQAQITIYPPDGTLPPNTVLWSVPIPGNPTIKRIIPAVPNSNDNIDVFAYDSAGYISAVSKDGALQWRNYVGGGKLTTGFSNEVFVVNPDTCFYGTDPIAGSTVVSPHKLQRLDKQTGQLIDLYQFGWQLDHPAGQVVGARCGGGPSVTSVGSDNSGTDTIIPTPDGKLFIQDLNSVSMMDIATNTIQAVANLETSTFVPVSGPTVTYAPYAGKMIVAGDGSAYVVYRYYQQTQLPDTATSTGMVQWIDTLMALRMSTDGTFAKTQLNQTTNVVEGGVPPYAYLTPSGLYKQRESLDDPLMLSIITNADAGATAFVPTFNGPTVTPTQTTLYPIAAGSAGAGVTLDVPSFTPVLQREDGNYVGTDSLNHLVALGAAGLLWQQTVIPDGFGGALPNYPRYLAEDGSVLTSSVPPQPGTQGTFYVVDPTGGTIQLGLDPGTTQSWRKASYSVIGDSLEQVAFQLPISDSQVSFWPEAGGNPASSGVATVHCMCLLQSDSATTAAATARVSTTNPLRPSAMATASFSDCPICNLPPADPLKQPPTSCTAPTGGQQLYVLLVGDSGLGEHNAGSLFARAAQTQANLLQSEGQNVVACRVSTIQDVFYALTRNGFIDGSAYYFGHSGVRQLIVRQTGQILAQTTEVFVGQDPGPYTNITALNVSILKAIRTENSGSHSLGPNAAFTINGCEAGATVWDTSVSQNISIAQLISDNLARGVYAYEVGMYFSHVDAQHDRNFDGGKRSMDPALPIYLIPAGDPGHKPAPTAFTSR